MRVASAFYAAVAGALLLAGGHAAAQTAAGPAAAESTALPIRWSVKDRFRLFDQADAPARLRVEALLDRIAAGGEPLSEHHDAFLYTLGYANGASLRTSHYQPVTPPTIGSGRYARDYLYPLRYTIRVALAAPTAPGALCTWRSDADRVTAPCAEQTEIAVAALPEPTAEGWQVDAPLFVSVGDAPEAATERVRLRDRLIVALGDSYISGEGNPDVPSVVTDRPLDKFRYASWGDKLRAEEGDFRPAVWWDEPCHRSLLSWPVLASLGYSAGEPREAVTLVHLGCSGAVVADMTTKGEVELPGGGDELPGETQLAKLERLLDAAPPGHARRKPDRILLSIGGNDAGFVGVIKTLFLPPNGYWFPIIGPVAVGGAGGAICPYRDTGRPLSSLCIGKASAEERLDPVRPDGLAARYAHLRRRTGLAVAGFEDEEAAADPDGARAAVAALEGKVFQFAYPNPLLAENGEACTLRTERDPERPEEMSGLEAVMGIIPRIFRSTQYSWNFQILNHGDAGRRVGKRIIETLDCDFLPEPGDSEVCQALWVHATLNQRVQEQSEHGWRAVTAHLKPIAGHGLCRDSKDFTRALPRVVNGRWDGGWTPQSFLPYHKDNPRWFRTPNDSIVTQYGGPDYFYHGTVHPTFSAHLEYAGAALVEALKPLADGR